MLLYNSSVNKKLRVTYILDLILPEGVIHNHTERVLHFNVQLFHCFSMQT